MIVTHPLIIIMIFTSNMSVDKVTFKCGSVLRACMGMPPDIILKIETSKSGILKSLKVFSPSNLSKFNPKIYIFVDTMVTCLQAENEWKSSCIVSATG